MPAAERAPRSGAAPGQTGGRVGPTSAAAAARNTLPAVQNDVVKRIMYSALLTGFGALASLMANRAAATVWRRLFAEEPPE